VDEQLRIGELSRRVGATPAVLRVWERRYALLEPRRSENGYRLYSSEDLRRATEMQAHIAQGVAPAQAAELAKAGQAGDPVARVASAIAPELLAQLRATLASYDGAAADELAERCLLTLGLAGAIQTVFLPFLREIGECWARAEIGVAQEHLATNVLRRRLEHLTVGWDRGGRHVALLACAPGELHELGLLSFGLALRHYHGWRIAYLGADTPATELVRAARVVKPDAVVASATTPAHFFRTADEWRTLARDARVAIGGAGATARLAKVLGVSYLNDDPVNAAARLADSA
jgi:DNA-binding transcriptional MerR regulator